MRAKAIKSLERLKVMSTKRRKSTVFKSIHVDEWHRCAAPGKLTEYIKLVSWCNKNVSKKYSRGEGAFWFEDKKDAFKFQLRWGKLDGK